jgi:hypothetical protein
MEFVALGEHSYVHCPQCGFPVSFLQGQEKPPETNVIEVASETVITLVCPTDGKFEVSAGEFRNNPPDAPQI